MATKVTGGEAKCEREAAASSEKAKLDAELDEALRETFPASDAAAIGHVSKEPDRPVHRRPPIIDLESVRRLARKVKG